MKANAQLKFLRLKHNLTQQYLAGKLGITQRAYSNIENGSTRITAYKADVLARELKSDPSDFLEEYSPIISQPCSLHQHLTERIHFYEKLIAGLEAQLSVKTQLILHLFQQQNKTEDKP